MVTADSTISIETCCVTTLSTMRSRKKPHRGTILGGGRDDRQDVPDLGPILEQHDAFICPTVAIPSIPAAMRPHELIEIDGHKVDADYGWCMTYPFNMLGQLPALAVPSGVSTSGVPTGVQIVARPFDDARAFRVARGVGKAQPVGIRHAASGAVS